GRRRAHLASSRSVDSNGAAMDPGTAYGMLRSLAIYYGVPWRGRRMARLYAEFVAPGSLCFDVGAHAGNRVRCWRGLGARVVAVEPQPEFVRLLRLLFGRARGGTTGGRAPGRAAGRATLRGAAKTRTGTCLLP